MRPSNRVSGIISYAGLEENALWENARRAFASKALPERFRGFLPVFPMELIVNMPYVGAAPHASPYGFSMSAAEYHRVLSQEIPDLYQGANRARCFDANGCFAGGVVTVDEAWAEIFPQYRPFMAGASQQLSNSYDFPSTSIHAWSTLARAVSGPDIFTVAGENSRGSAEKPSAVEPLFTPRTSTVLVESLST